MLLSSTTVDCTTSCIKMEGSVWVYDKSCVLNVGWGPLIPVILVPRITFVSVFVDPNLIRPD